MDQLSPTLLYAHYTQHNKRYMPSHVFPSRITKSYELTYFLPGSDCKMILDDVTYPINGDTVVFRRPGQSNQSFMPYESILIGFTFDSLSTFASDVHLHDLEAIEPCGLMDIPFLKGISSVNNTLKLANYRHLFENLYKESLLNRPFAHYYYTAKILEILYALSSESGSHITAYQPSISDETLIDLMKYIESHLTENITVKRISKDLCISERHIYNVFKKYLNATPIQYITEGKINYARNLLKTSNLPIHEVAEMCGYENSTYFITLFRKTTGLTPLKYRKALITM